MAALNCVYLGWKRPALELAAGHLLDRYVRDGMADMTLVTVALPTQRAGRRLRELLIDQAAERNVGLFPPRIVATSGLPELLYELQRPFAAPLVQQFAWTSALQSVSRSILDQVVPETPQADSDPRWLELGRMLQQQHLELASHGYRFADVAAVGEEVAGFSEQRRWQAMAKVQERYWETLDEHQLWDRPAARNYAIEHGECQLAGDLILVGVVDLTPTLKTMVRQLGSQVTSLVYADASWAVRFDDLGCVTAEAWQHALLDVKSHQILVADGPASQADAVIHALDDLDGKYAAEDITIGVPDVSLVPHLENTLGQFGLPARWGPGASLAVSRPVQWLRVAADYLVSGRYEHLAELVRHPDTGIYLRSAGYERDAVRELDRYYEQHLPDQVPLARPQQPEPAALSTLRKLLGSLGGAPQSPGAWGHEILRVLEKLYARPLRDDREADRVIQCAVEKMAAAVEWLDQLPQALSPQVTAGTAILMLLGQLDDEGIPAASEEHAIEMVGWLDLPLDDARVAIVTSMNDGVVPKSVHSDAFMPNALRQALGFDDNAQRYARDAYALQTLLQSRMVLRLVVGKRQATNDPLRPSRLLLAMPPEKLASRCLRLFGSAVDTDRLLPEVAREESTFHVPRPQPLVQPLDTLAVSDFSSYLRCPYRFYLRKVLRLRTLDDRDRELNAAAFGDVCHHVLESFGRSESRDSSDEHEIRLCLFQFLAELSRERFGERPKPAVQVQLAQLQQRLTAFATQQAEWRQAGWEILKVEHTEEAGRLNVDGEPVRLIGRVDRIDRRTSDEGEEYAVLDYKTGDAGDAPDKKHLPGLTKARRASVTPDDWQDLQLPLYRHLLRGGGVVPDDACLRLGYVLLPASPSRTGFAMADWSEVELQSADRAAEGVVRCIRAEQFWPPKDPYKFAQTDEYAAIVQCGVFGREVFSEEAIGA